MPGGKFHPKPRPRKVFHAARIEIHLQRKRVESFLWIMKRAIAELESILFARSTQFVPPKHFVPNFTLPGLFSKTAAKADEALMIGNDDGKDLVAGMIGIRTYLIDNAHTRSGGESRLIPSYFGDYATLQFLIQDGFPL